MKKPVCELFVRSEFPREELRSVIVRDGDDIRTGTELTPQELKKLGYSYKERYWQGTEEDIMRLFDKWTAKQSTLSAVVYNNKGDMLASYIKEDA